MTPFQARIHGVIPALLTPLNQDLSLDVGGMRRLVRRVIDHGCHGFVVLGSTGEFASIDDDARAVAIRVSVEEAAGQVPVIVGCGQPNVRRTHEQLRTAGDLGADGVLVNPPFYFPLTQDEIVRCFEGVVNASPVPVLLYNFPAMTKVTTGPQTLWRLREIGVQGTKDSSGDVGSVMAYIEATRDDPAFRIIVGGDRAFLHVLISGGCATTGPTPNLAPQLDLAIYDAYRENDLQAAAAAQNRCNAFLRTFVAQGEFAQTTAKAVLDRLGIIQKWVAPPKTTMSEADAEQAFEAVKPYLPEFEASPAG